LHVPFVQPGALSQDHPAASGQEVKHLIGYWIVAQILHQALSVAALTALARIAA
jgi:hypothetical protein